jgi:hypothetical protein
MQKAETSPPVFGIRQFLHPRGRMLKPRVTASKIGQRTKSHPPGCAIGSAGGHQQEVGPRPPKVGVEPSDLLRAMPFGSRTSCSNSRISRTRTTEALGMKVSCILLSSALRRASRITLTPEQSMNVTSRRSTTTSPTSWSQISAMDSASWSAVAMSISPDANTNPTKPCRRMPTSKSKGRAEVSSSFMSSIVDMDLP